MEGIRSKQQGVPTWADCATTDLDAAERFYSTVFGWTPERMRGADGNLYSVQRLDGAMVAGLYELDPRLRSMGVPPHWGTYMHVDDVAATLERVKAAGGTVLEEPITEPGVGTIAIIQDPVGGFLRLWHPEPEHGAEIFDVPGAMTWNELCTKEPEKAAAFYAAVFGVAVERMGLPTPYITLNVAGRPVAGILKQTPEMGDFPTSWDVYFATDDVDRAAETAIAAGGTVLRAPFDVPGGSRMAVLQDPQGAVFEVIRMSTDHG